MMLWVLCNRNRRLVVHIEHRGCSHVVSKFREEGVQPDDLLACRDCSDKFSLSCGEGDDGLEFAAQGDRASSHFHEISACRAPIIRVSTMVRICVACKE